MLKTTYQYEQTAARLVVEGFPDLSAGQSNEAIGILSSWRLQLIGAPELEGTRDHLEALMAAVMPTPDIACPACSAVLAERAVL